MRPADQLSQFVREALIAGRSRADIETAMVAAGWSPGEVREALSSWSDAAFTPPVPRPRPYVSAREAFFYALMFVALGMTAWHLVQLGFGLVERWYPEGDYGTYRSSGSIRWAIAALIVFFPVFILMQTSEQRSMRADPARCRSAVRKWFGYATLFLASVALLGDLLATIYGFLSGDLTVKFALKSLIVAVVAGVIFAYFRKAMHEAEDVA